MPAANGVSYFTSAGNFGSRSYEGTLLGSNSSHDFSGSGDTLQRVELDKGFYLIVLQWEDNFYSIGETIGGGTKNDLDIYLKSDDGSILYGFNRDNLGGDPFEVMPFEVINATSTNIAIEKASGSTDDPVKFKYIVFRAGDSAKFDAEYLNVPPLPTSPTENSTIVGHANAKGAMTVGAARYTNTSQLESFSSTGGTPVAGEVGLRLKPDFTGPDGGNTSVNFGSKDLEGDNIPNFFGTSASAPHVGAVAALLLEAKDTFGIDIGSQQSDDWIKNTLQQTASNMGVHNFADGFGFISAINAIDGFANPSPQLIALNLENLDTSIYAPGDTSFTLILEGAYFGDETVVFFRDDTLDNVTIINDSTAEVTIPSFIGNPPLYVLNAQAPNTNGNDGGSSDTLTFSDPVFEDIVIKVDNTTKKYGVPIPALSFSVVFAETGLPIPQEHLDLLAPSISLSTTATPLSLIVDAGYAITATWDEGSLDPAITELYNLSATLGILSIEPIQVTITPVTPDPITYGDSLPAIQYTYTFDGPVDQAILDRTQQQHETGCSCSQWSSGSQWCTGSQWCACGKLYY